MTSYLCRPSFLRIIFSICIVALLGAGACSNCRAGGGSENVFLLVNETSQDSLTIANHYIDLRKIPASNVYYLKWPGNKAWATGRVIRDVILQPAFDEIDRRKLGGQIDYLIYSSDFPWWFVFTKDFPDEKFPPQLSPASSLTGATYLWAFVKEKRKEMFSLNTNFYCTPMHKGGITVSRGFRSQYRWAPGGKRAGTKGLPYMLSAMLGVTYGRGNTTEEIVRYLRRSVAADGTAPKGTVYYVQNDNPRSIARHDLFPTAAKELRMAGVEAKILDGKFPQGKQDIIGVTTGAAHLGLVGSKSRFLPGAFCDNLTSSGGQFDIPKNPPGQTCISEFLRLGAAGACGTVVEPYAIQQKFPLPSVHVHYARGCSLAEAFYQSVAGPYQQMLVGDPLCQPWADRPVVKVKGVSNGAMIRGEVELVPSAAVTSKKGVRTFELYVDGVRTKRCLPGGKLSLDTTLLADGYHELRVVATDNTPIETQGRWIGGVMVKNGRNAVQLTVDPSSQLADAKHLLVKVASTSKQKISVIHNGRPLGQVEGGSGVVRIAKDRLGAGPITLHGQSDGEKGLRSRPLRVDIK